MFNKQVFSFVLSKTWHPILIEHLLNRKGDAKKQFSHAKVIIFMIYTWESCAQSCLKLDQKKRKSLYISGLVLKEKEPKLGFEFDQIKIGIFYR